MRRTRLFTNGELHLARVTITRPSVEAGEHEAPPGLVRRRHMKERETLAPRMPTVSSFSLAFNLRVVTIHSVE